MVKGGTLPRTRICVPVLPPALERNPQQPVSGRSETHLLDIDQLRNDIDTLTEQLTEVRAQLTSSVCRSEDSRLSTILHSPYSDHGDPTPSPSRPYPSPKPVTLPRRESLAQQNRETTVDRRTWKSSGIISIPQSTLPPPKPHRTYAETTCSDMTVSSSSTAAPRWNGLWRIKDDDLVHIDALAETLTKSFNESICWFELGKCLLFLNPYNDLGAQRTVRYSPLNKLTTQALSHNEYTVFFDGESGSGKSFLAEQFVMGIADRTTRPRGVLSSALSASITMLHAMTSANTTCSNRASRMVHWWEMNVREGRLQRVRLRHFLSDSTARHCAAILFSTIATQMGSSEKERFRIGGFQLGNAQPSHIRLSDLRNALNILCIPFDDVMRLVAACILLNNLLYYETDDGVDIENIADMEDAAFLLGISALTLFKRLTSRSTIIKKESVTTLKTLAVARLERDSIVCALYSRCVQSIVKRANALLELAHSEINDEESVNDSGIGMSDLSSSRIDVIDMPGMSTKQRTSLYELCLNISAEKTRSFFMRNATEPKGRIQEPSIFSDLLKPKHGFLNLLDHICDQPSGSLSMLMDISQQRKEPFQHLQLSSSELVVRHYAGRVPVTYTLSKLVERNKNNVRKELVRMFDSNCCSFKFVVSLFATDVEAMAQRDQYRPKIIKCPTVDTEQTFSQQFLNKVDTLLKRCTTRNLQIVHCVRSNNNCEFSKVDQEILKQQIVNWKLLQIGHKRTRVVSPRVHVERTPESVPTLPTERNYVVKDGRKHYFPQRRQIIVDYQDMSSGVCLRAGEFVKAVSFYMADSYLVENERSETASVPCRFTDKSAPSSNVVDV